MGSNPTRSASTGFGQLTPNDKQFAVSNFKQWIESKNYVKDYRVCLINKIPLILPKRTYTFDSVPDTILNKINLINSNKNCNRLVKLLLHYLEDQEILSNEHILEIKKKITNIKENVDNHVPTDNEVLQTLSQLTSNNRLVYLMYLMNGLRKVEGVYLLDKFDSLKCQQFDGFVKITMNYLRNTKNSYFCYLPLEVYSKLLANYKLLSTGSLESEIKRKKLIPVKYCRKWFYTKCIELGIPESIADYYQGRVSNLVGSNHYLSRQLLADQNYSEIVNYLNRFN